MWKFLPKCYFLQTISFGFFPKNCTDFSSDNKKISENAVKILTTIHLEKLKGFALNVDLYFCINAFIWDCKDFPQFCIILPLELVKEAPEKIIIFFCWALEYYITKKRKKLVACLVSAGAYMFQLSKFSEAPRGALKSPETSRLFKRTPWDITKVVLLKARRFWKNPSVSWKRFAQIARVAG